MQTETETAVPSVSFCVETVVGASVILVHIWILNADGADSFTEMIAEMVQKGIRQKVFRYRFMQFQNIIGR